MWEYAAVGAAGVLVGVLADRLIVALNKKRKEVCLLSVIFNNSTT